MTVFLAAAIKPFLLLAVLLFFWAVRTGIQRFMPDCKFKRLLLRPI